MRNGSRFSFRFAVYNASFIVAWRCKQVFDDFYKLSLINDYAAVFVSCFWSSL